MSMATFSFGCGDNDIFDFNKTMTPFSILAPNELAWPKSYGLPPEHCADVLAGSYNVPYNPATPPVCLDLGANVGGFVRWAVKRWPGATIHAYEPCPSNYAMLCETVNKLIPLADMQRVFTHQQAVAGHTCRATLQAGEFNCGEWSLMMPPVEGREKVEMDVISACDLPKADVLKVDTEGAEVVILAALTLAGRIKEFSAILLEVHNPDWVKPICFRLQESGFTLTGESSPYPNRYELKFVRADLLPADFKP